MDRVRNGCAARSAVVGALLAFTLFVSGAVWLADPYTGRAPMAVTRVEECLRCASGRYECRVDVQYSYRNHTVQARRVLVHAVRALAAGDVIRLSFDPDRPADVIQATWRFEWTMGWAAIGVSAALTLCVASVVGATFCRVTGGCGYHDGCRCCDGCCGGCCRRFCCDSPCCYRCCGLSAEGYTALYSP